MLLDVLPLAGGGARLVRVYCGQPCAQMPGLLPAPQPEQSALELCELGDYCFAPTPRALPAPQQLCRYEADETDAGAPVRCVGALGEAKPTPQLPPLCGGFLEQAVLPGTLRVIGSCAFYNCRKLKSLSFGAQGLAIGSDVFLNCFELKTITLRAEPEQATGLFAIVNNIPEAVRAVFWPPRAAQPSAAFWYPAYWEDIEETPAHILLHTFSGQGYHYRQCFASGRLLAAEYDAIFAQGHAAEEPEVMAALCCERLRWPWALSEGAAAAYREYLGANSALAVNMLLKQQDLPGISALIALGVMGADALAAGADMAARADNAAAAALFAAAERQARAAAPKKERYSFDF